MELSIFLKTIGIGFSVAAAVGPISLLCVQRTLQNGFGIGLASGMGTASADALYGLIGGLGLSVITNFLVGQQFMLRLVGGMALVYLGLKTFLTKADIQAAKENHHKAAGFLGAYTSNLLLTLSNPMTIISYIAIYAGIGALGLNNSWSAAAAFALAIFIGSSIWWLALVSSVNLLRSRFNPSLLLKLNYISGMIIAGFGVVILWQILIG